MSWNIDFYYGVMDSILDMPPKIQAKMLKLLELMERHGANLMGNGLFELRAKAQEGIGRGLFCYLDGSNICILHAFVKKGQKTPKKDLDLAKSRMKEVKK
ncbi:type II toxin-antitoxin system RelE/ParE family toxin [Xenorhabdus ishibashii]|nr:type II toxin-antitoxin system RelE/ParE family toxin [Xenorhabdus ishibashii]